MTDKGNKTYLLRLLFLILVVSACNPLRKIGSDPQVFKWEQEVQGLEKMPVSNDAKTLLFVGSSSIRLWKDVGSDMNPYQAIVRGYGGAKLNDLAFYVRRITDPHQCGAIVIFVANDISGDAADKTPVEILDLFKLTLNQIRKKHPDTPVFWIEITPTPLRWQYWDLTSKANQLIKDYCNKEVNLFFIPTSYRFVGENGQPDPKLFLQDNLHLNRSGYQVWSECIKQVLDQKVPELK